MAQFHDLSRSPAALDENSTLIAVVEMSRSSWLVGGIIPGVRREPLKKLPPDAPGLWEVLVRWRDEALGAGHVIKRICVAYEAGRDGFWLARWLRRRGVECHVIHPTSVSVSREHRRAKTDRLDVALLKRSFLGWLRGEAKHCSMVWVPTLEEEDAKRPLRERDNLVREQTRLVNRMTSVLALHGIVTFNVKLKRSPERLAGLETMEGEPLPPHTLAELRRGMERLGWIKQQIAALDAARLERLEAAPQAGLHPMILVLAKVIGVGVATAEQLVREALSRRLRDRRAVARYAGLTGSPDESGQKRREKGLAKAGNSRLRRAMLQLAWRFLVHQPDCALVKWFHARAADGRHTTKKTMIVAPARKLLVALWELVTTGKLPEGVRLHPAVA